MADDAGSRPGRPSRHGAPGHEPVTAIEFAGAARLISSACRHAGLVVPGFRTPPRLVGLDRTVRRHGGGATVSVRVRDRPWPAVVADMVEGVVAVNGLDARGASRARADLWAALAQTPLVRRVA